MRRRSSTASMSGLTVLAAGAVGALSIVLGEVTSVLLLQTAPGSIDLTGNYFLLVAWPGILAAVVVSTILLLRLLRRNPGQTLAAYACTYIVTFVVLLTVLGNPISNIVTYVVIILVTVAAVMGGTTVWLRRH